MDFDLSRLRRGEALAGVSAAALLAFVFVLQWYGPRAGGARPVASVNGWEAFTVWRWLALVTIFGAFCLVFFQATRRAPALPVSASLIVTAVAVVSAVWLAIRVLFDHPAHQRIGAVLGLLSALGVMLGGYLSLRAEGLATRDEPAEIRTVRLENASPRAR